MLSTTSTLSLNVSSAFCGLSVIVVVVVAEYFVFACVFVCLFICLLHWFSIQSFQ